MTNSVMLTFAEVKDWLRAQPFNRKFRMYHTEDCLVGQFLRARHSVPARDVSVMFADATVTLEGPTFIRYKLDTALGRFIFAESERSVRGSLVVSSLGLLYRMDLIDRYRGATIGNLILDGIAFLFGWRRTFNN